MRQGAVVALLFAALPLAAAADDVTIYRCTDSNGHLTLRDTPCRRDQKQQTLNMVRPKDAPIPIPAPAPPPVREDAYVPPPRTIVVQAPRPMYECIPPDGEPYTSDNGEGRPRWVPLWTLGYPVALPTPGMASTAGLSITHGNVHIDGRRTLLVPPVFTAAAYGAGTWIRDDCHPLPQNEACARLVDRRDEIRRRFFNAMPNERDVLRVEERGIDARIENDCGTY